MMPCELCGVPLDTREAMPQCWGHMHTSAHLCANNLADENARLRDRERRIVRVYWRIRDDAGNITTRDDRWRAFRTRAWWGGKVWRVTVRTKAVTP